jgi:Ser/Thr protein kinase RdoA (MazF antagonist)
MRVKSLHVTRPTAPAEAHVRDAAGAFVGVHATGFARIRGGLIHHSYLVEATEGRFVLQRLHQVFAPEVNLDVAAVTEHVSTRGLVTPMLCRAEDGRPWADLGEAGIWRALTFIPGTTFDAVDSPAQAHAAGALLGRFHGALDDLDHEFVAPRDGVHDIARHVGGLEAALDRHRGHRLHAEVARLAESLVRAVESLPALTGVRERVVHGDPKLNNVRFAGRRGDARTRAVCMIDLDTVGRMPLWQELGDALRSWSNRAGEDAAAARYDADVHDAALAGYGTALRPHLDPDEREALTFGVDWITVELAIRFATDALAECYFGWDPGRFPGAGEHNLVRARGQWSLHCSVAASRSARASALRNAFASGTLAS